MNRSPLILIFFFALLVSACTTQKKSMPVGGLTPGDTGLFVSADEAAVIESIIYNEMQLINSDIDIKQQEFHRINSNQIYFPAVDSTDSILVVDSAEVVLKLHPFAIAGVGLTAAAVITGVFAFTGPMLPIWVSLLLLGGGLTFATLGIKKIKQQPEVYKGEKLATSVYWAMIPIGLFLMLLPIYLLFEF